MNKLLGGTLFILMSAFCTTAQTYDKEKQQILELVNQHRANLGLQKVILVPEISAVCEKHSKRMADGIIRMSHTGFEERTGAFVNNGATENIAWTGGDGKSAFQLWKDDPPHRVNMEGASLNQMGVGIAKDSKGMLYYTQVFIASPNSAKPIPNSGAKDRGSNESLCPFKREQQKDPNPVVKPVQPQKPNENTDKGIGILKNVRPVKNQITFMYAMYTMFYFNEDKGKGAIRIDNKEYSIDDFAYNDKTEEFEFWGNEVDIVVKVTPLPDNDVASSKKITGAPSDALMGRALTADIETKTQKFRLSNLTVVDCPKH